MPRGVRRGSASGLGPGMWKPLVSLALVVSVVLALALGLALGLRALVPGLRRWEPGSERLPAGVYFEDAGRRIELGGLSRFEAAGALEEVAGDLGSLPLDAYVDRSTKGAVPGLDGRRLDVAATVAKALTAAAGQVIRPELYGVPPAVTLQDFPASPVYQGNPGKSEVSIILNVAWGDEYLDPILAEVEKSGGRLSICPTGAWIEGDQAHASWLATAASRGHEVGNHGYYNRPMTYGEVQVREELKKTSDLIERACGRRPAVFAPPMGEFTPSTLRAAAADGYRTVKWSLDTIDWQLGGVDVIAERVTSRVRGGDIILCHPTAQTSPALQRFLPTLAEKGLRVVTLSELLSSSPAAQDEAALAPPEGG